MSGYRLARCGRAGGRHVTRKQYHGRRQIDPRGFVLTNDVCQTNVPGIYAIGDVSGPPMLAHKASKEGEICA